MAFYNFLSVSLFIMFFFLGLLPVFLLSCICTQLGRLDPLGIILQALFPHYAHKKCQLFLFYILIINFLFGSVFPKISLLLTCSIYAILNISTSVRHLRGFKFLLHLWSNYPEFTAMLDDWYYLEAKNFSFRFKRHFCLTFGTHQFLFDCNFGCRYLISTHLLK